MTQLPAILELLKTASGLLNLKQQANVREMRKAVSRSIHDKQTAETEARLEKALAPVFEGQIEEMAAELKKMGGKSVHGRISLGQWLWRYGCNALKELSEAYDKGGIESAIELMKGWEYDDEDHDYTGELRETIKEWEGIKSAQDAATSLTKQIFNPDDPKWQKQVADAALPVLAVGMAEAAVAHLLAVGVDIRKKSGDVWRKDTTATEWLTDHPEDIAKLEELLVDSGLDIRVFTELPDWMKRNIADQLTTSFAQPYWQDIHATTAGDAEVYLRRGLEEGWSIRRMADTMAQSFVGDTGKYARMRATRIARTESGNALNGARKASIDGLVAELPPDVSEFIRPSWLSVLGTTTRDTHANLDGVPADDEGMWMLSGVRVPWPGHYSLPAGERINCQCLPGGVLVKPIGGLVAASRMFYCGPLVEIETGSGCSFYITPNHSVLTTKGWIRAGELQAGMHVLGDRGGDSFCEDIEHEPISIEKVFQSLRALPSRIESRRRLPFQFHGDAEFGQGEIETVVSDVVLSNPSPAEGFQHGQEFDFMSAASKLGRSTYYRSVFNRGLFPSNVLGFGVASQDTEAFEKSLYGRARDALPSSDFNLSLPGQVIGDYNFPAKRNSFFEVGSSKFGFGGRSNRHPVPFQSNYDASGIALVDSGDFVGILPFVDVHLDEVVGVRLDLDFSGHVYDLQTSSGVYSSQGIIVHNCTITTEFGLGQQQAGELINEYNQRVAEQ